jgi:hypothetical protein
VFCQYSGLYPCPVSLSFCRPSLKFFPFRLLKSVFCFPLFVLRNLVSLDVLLERSFGSKPFCFSQEDEHLPLLFQSLVLLFSQPTTSHPSPCSHRLQPWTSSTTFIIVHFGLEMQATGGFSFQRWRSLMEFRSVARGYSESQNCTKYSAREKSLKSWSPK